MKLNKKALSLIVAGVLSVGMLVGCGNNEVKQEPQVKQEQVQEQPQENVQDEDLNDQYQAKIDANDVQKAKDVLDPILTENFGADGYTILTYEEYNGVVIVIDLKISELQTATINDWNDLVSIMTELQLTAQQYVQQQGLDVNVGLMVADVNADEPLLSIVNGEVVLDIVNNIDRLS